MSGCAWHHYDKAFRKSKRALTVTCVGRTGRFAGATGTATLAGRVLPDGSLAVAVVGTIDY